LLKRLLGGDHGVLHGLGALRGLGLVDQVTRLGRSEVGATICRGVGQQGLGRADVVLDLALVPGQHLQHAVFGQALAQPVEEGKALQIGYGLS